MGARGAGGGRGCVVAGGARPLLGGGLYSCQVLGWGERPGLAGQAPVWRGAAAQAWLGLPHEGSRQGIKCQCRRVCKDVAQAQSRMLCWALDRSRKPGPPLKHSAAPHCHPPVQGGCRVHALGPVAPGDLAQRWPQLHAGGAGGRAGGGFFCAPHARPVHRPVQGGGSFAGQVCVCVAACSSPRSLSAVGNDARTHSSHPSSHFAPPARSRPACRTS